MSISIPSKGSHGRALIKTVAWRVVASVTTMIIVYLFTEDALISFEIGLVEVVAKMILYYLHERVWDKI